MFLSVIIPTYNREKLIGRAIKSVLNQSFSDFEIIVIDDGSKDTTKGVVNSFKDQRIKYIYQENKERSAARNNGIRNATGEWICFLDSDDYVKPNFLFNLHNEISKNNVDCYLTGHTKKFNNKVEVSIKDPLPEVDYVVDYCLTNNETIPTCSLITRRSIFLTHNFDERFSNWEDTYLYLILLSNYKYKSLRLYDYVWVLHEESGNVINEHKLELQFIEKYLFTINDLFLKHGNELKIRGDKSSLKKQYIRMKLKMFFYRAYLKNEVKLMFAILKMHFVNKIYARDIIYYLKSVLKIIYKLITTRITV